MNDVQTGCEGGSILIVDDTPSNLGLLTRMLTLHGYQVQAATSGSMALAAVEVALPELILLDVCMPELDGYEICKRLKADIRTQEIPVIFMSGLYEIVDKIKAFDVGGVDYITKPFRVPEVIARVKTHITIRQLQQQLQKQNELLRQEVRIRISAEVAFQSAIQELEWIAHSDGLTQLANRRRFDEYLSVEWRRLMREKLPLSLILCDVDFFKSYNDSYGHQAGDRCLCQIAKVLQKTVKRPADLVARYGGEEFVILLPNTPPLGAVKVAQEIQTQIKKLGIIHAGSQVSDLITLSLGVATALPVVEVVPEQLIAMADQALYRAKAMGRNQIVVEEMKSEAETSFDFS